MPRLMYYLFELHIPLYCKIGNSKVTQHSNSSLIMTLMFEPLHDPSFFCQQAEVNSVATLDRLIQATKYDTIDL
jgi:hypothetical protein